MKDFIRSLPQLADACAIGFAAAERVDKTFDDFFSRWLADGKNGSLDYMANHRELRSNPQKLLPGAKTVIAIAFSYNQPVLRDKSLPMIARYAYGKDYHNVLRQILKKAVTELQQHFGGDYRICIDSAPIPERYWALRASIGRRGRNGCVIVDGAGSFIFLTEILTTLEIKPDEPTTRTCLDCGRCIRECPTGALTPDGLDASRCLSALTIERKGPWTDSERRIMALPAARSTLFGCDRCQTVCPHNAAIPATPIDALLPKRQTASSADTKNGLDTLTLTSDDILHLSQDDFDNKFAGSPLRRPGLDALRRNALNTLQDKH